MPRPNDFHLRLLVFGGLCLIFLYHLLRPDGSPRDPASDVKVLLGSSSAANSSSEQAADAGARIVIRDHIQGNESSPGQKQGRVASVENAETLKKKNGTSAEPRDSKIEQPHNSQMKAKNQVTGDQKQYPSKPKESVVTPESHIPSGGRQEDETPPESPNETKVKTPVMASTDCAPQNLSFTQLLLQSETTWRQLTDRAYLYTAYYDVKRNASQVKVIGLSHLNVSIYCRVWDKEGTVMSHGQATIEIPIRAFHVHLETVHIWCPVSKEIQDGGGPSWVTLTSSSTPCDVNPLLVTLPVTQMYPRPLKYNFTVCLHQAMVDTNDTDRFIEWVEANMMYGAQRFILYNRTASSRLLPYVRHYVEAGVMEVYPWNISQLTKYLSYKKSQNGVLLDCTYRSMYETKYLVMKDLDELIVPTQHRSWADMLEHSPCRNQPSVMVKCVIFDLLFPQDGDYSERLSMYKLQTLAYTKRINYTWDCGIRSKVMARPDLIKYPNVHHAEADTLCCLPAQSATVFHHRRFNMTYYDTWKEFYSRRRPYQAFYDVIIEDKRMYDFAGELISRVAKVHERVDKRN